MTDKSHIRLEFGCTHFHQKQLVLWIDSNYLLFCFIWKYLNTKFHCPSNQCFAKTFTAYPIKTIIFSKTHYLWVLYLMYSFDISLWFYWACCLGLGFHCLSTEYQLWSAGFTYSSDSLPAKLRETFNIIKEYFSSWTIYSDFQNRKYDIYEDIKIL